MQHTRHSSKEFFFLTTDDGKILAASIQAGRVQDLVINCVMAMSELGFSVQKIVMQKIRYRHKKLCVF